MLITWYIENKFFIYAMLLHILLFFTFERLSNISEAVFDKVKSENIQVETYDKFPFEQKKQKAKELNKENKISDSLNNIQKEMLSYSVDGFDITLDAKGAEQAKDINNTFDREFKEIQKESDNNKKSIFKHSQDIETLSKVYGYIKKNSENIELMANISNDDEEILRSKNLLLSYENYQKTLFYNILKNWKHPEFADENWSCRVEVEQSSTGNVMSIKFLECVDNERFRRAVKIALFKSSPLPLPTNKEIYNKLIYFTFKAN